MLLNRFLVHTLSCRRQVGPSHLKGPHRLMPCARTYGLFDFIKKNEEALLKEQKERADVPPSIPPESGTTKKFNYPWNKQTVRSKPSAERASTPESHPSTETTNPSPPEKSTAKPGKFNLPWHNKSSGSHADSTPKPHSQSPLPKDPASGPTDIVPAMVATTDSHGDPLVQSEVRVSSLERGAGRFPYRILGDESQVVEVELEPNQVVRAEVGSVISLDPGVEMETSTGGGFGKGLTRMITGESFFITDFRNTNPTGVAKLVFGASYPCKVLPMSLAAHGGTLICQKGAFLCGDPEVQINMFFTQKLTAGFFGGEGFILQKLDGQGMVLLKGGGASIVKDLAAGEVLTVSTGTIIAFEQSVHYDVQFVKGGAKNVLFGGQGLFLLKLTGPGSVWLQGLPFDRVVDTVVSSLR